MPLHGDPEGSYPFFPLAHARIFTEFSVAPFLYTMAEAASDKSPPSMVMASLSAPSSCKNTAARQNSNRSEQSLPGVNETNH
jgi:hypothetical protein